MSVLNITVLQYLESKPLRVCFLGFGNPLTPGVKS